MGCLQDVKRMVEVMVGILMSIDPPQAAQQLPEFIYEENLPLAAPHGRVRKK